MTEIQKMAFEAAVRITAGSVQSFDIAQTSECAEDVADYFETLYNRLLTIAKSNKALSSED